jgi:aerobic carbon-monoxide dehydrogenase large subunit
MRLREYTVPTGPYRGAGRPEANYVLERLSTRLRAYRSLIASNCVERNLIPPTAMPYKTAIGTVYDSGDFSPIVDRALDLSRY